MEIIDEKINFEEAEAYDCILFLKDPSIRPDNLLSICKHINRTSGLTKKSEVYEYLQFFQKNIEFIDKEINEFKKESFYLFDAMIESFKDDSVKILFNIKIQKNAQDDYGMMKEVLNRRFKRAVQEKDNYLTFPDLVLIDGGKGQYSVAREAMNELGLHEIPIVAIAKGKMRNSGNETFFHNGKEFKFEKNDPTLFFLQRLRDESHRFAISAHRAKRKKGISKSLLDQIDGIGSIRKRALLNHFGSARAVESASLDEIKSVDGVEEKVAKKIYTVSYTHLTLPTICSV